MTWVTPRDWTTSQLVTAPQMDEISDALNSIHDDNIGALWVVLEDDAAKTTSAIVDDEEKARSTVLMGDHNTAGLKVQLRMVGSRLVSDLGGGSNDLKLQYGGRSAGDTGDPTWTTAATVATANEATATWQDTGWVDVTMTTATLLVVRYTADATNTSQVTTTRMTVLARLKDA